MAGFVRPAPTPARRPRLAARPVLRHGSPVADPLVLAARRVLEAHWDDERGYCVPNPAVYPHLWLWDSCFHAVAWAALGEVERAGRELRKREWGIGSRESG